MTAQHSYDAAFDRLDRAMSRGHTPAPPQAAPVWQPRRDRDLRTIDRRQRALGALTANWRRWWAR